jgi:exonuclease SbcC
MIPLKLSLQGFLSYCDPVDVDFTSFDLACISGANGAGKSSLLDAITWALFGQARKRDDALINARSDAAEVAFTFRYEENVYRVQRTLPRGKSTLLEFQIQNGEAWRPLTERTMRETQARIEQTLRLDYDTFVNASFFLQGKADQFTQQKSSERKRVLASILGLEAWEIYRERTAARRKDIEKEMDTVDGRLREINAELDEEPTRKARLSELEVQLAQLIAVRKTQESALATMNQVAASLTAQSELADRLRAQYERATANLSALEARLSERQAERSSHADLLARAKDVEKAYKAWLSVRAELEKWDALAGQFHEHERRRQPFVEEISAEKARLEQEQSALDDQRSRINENQSAIDKLQTEIEPLKEKLSGCEAKLAQRDEAREELDAAREQTAALRAENEALKAQMDEVKARIERMKGIESAACPLCGQPLSKEHRASTIAQLGAEGKEMGDRWRANKSRIEQLARKITALETQLSDLSPVEKERLALAGQLSTLGERLDNLTRSVKEWNRQGAKRLKAVDKLLKNGKFVAEAQKGLALIDKELKKLGYDAAQHDALRRAESEGRSSDDDHRALESARAALTPLEREIADINKQIASLQVEVEQQRKEYDEVAAALAEAEAQAPDIRAAERALLEAQERENILNQDVGAARQKVAVLDDLRARRARLETEREGLALQVAHHKTLERAFGKDGVPALLIEQALPEIEGKANELLDRLSNGAMSVRFVTQAEYKDKKRGDLKETLDIQISDGAGLRDYELFSGGEAFRVNFAIRLALSKILAQRTGARLQTLVIDEGFGSQDTQGRQRLIEAINLVKGDFAKILIITHLDELKEAFPNRIEVEKTPNGSMVTVI